MAMPNSRRKDLGVSATMSNSPNVHTVCSRSSYSSGTGKIRANYKSISGRSYKGMWPDDVVKGNSVKEKADRTDARVPKSIRRPGDIN